MASLGYVALRASRTTLEEAIGKSSCDLADRILNEIDRNISNRTEEIQACATDELAKEQISLSNAHFENVPNLDFYIEQVESEWSSENNILTPLISQLSGNELARKLRSRQDFYLNKYGYSLLAEMFVTNKFGVNIAQTNKTTDYYQADEEWWQCAKQNGLFVSDIKYDESSGTFSYDIGARINDANGSFIGVAKAVINSQETINAINEAKANAGYKTTQLHLLNRDGKILYSTKSYTLFEDATEQLVPRFGKPGQPNHKGFVVGQKEAEKGILFAHVHSKGYKDFGGLGWTLLMETDTKEVFAPIANLRNTMLLSGLAILCVALLTGSITYRSIVIPIAQLQNATVQIAAGNLDPDLQTGEDEIGQLAGSFQNMSQQLKKTITDLNAEIAERKKAETRLYENIHFLDDIFDAIQDGISFLDTDLNIVKVNSWMEKMYACRMPLVGKKCYNAYHQDRTSICPGCPSVQALQTGTTHTNVVPYPFGEQQGWIELTSFPLKNSEGKIVGVIEHVKDITEKKKAEIALNKRAEQIMHHHNILLKLANMPEQEIDSLLRIISEQDAEVLNVERVGIWFYSPERTKIVCRDLFRKSEKAHASGSTLVVKDYPRYFNTLEENRILSASDAQNDPMTSEFTKDYLKPMGITSMIDVPIRLHGKIVGIVCNEHIGPMREWILEEQDFAASVADMISLKLEAMERRKAEEALEKLNKDLHATIEELSRTNGQMQDFVHIAAHDLKTPVRGIGTLADWIISDYGDKLDEHGREQVRLLKARVIRIDKLIEGMLQFSKITRNRKGEKKVNLNEVLSEVTDKIKPPDNIEIAVDSLPTVICEHNHISQVFQNLLSNAIMFMDKPKGLIKVGCVEQGDFWKFYVCDNGPGIEQKHFERIFKIFQTLPKKDQIPSAGIGLAIAKKITELYGGKIWIESRLGTGSTFFFTLPKQQEEIIYEHTKSHTSC